LTIEVRDQSGAGIPEAAVLLTEVATNQVIGAKTGTGGLCTFPNLRPGSYAIAVEAPGFKRYTRENIQLGTGERLRLGAELPLGGIHESVVVSSATPILITESTGLGQRIDSRKIVDLPLNGRSFIPLVALSPGVALPPGSAFPRINGGRPRVNEYLFDGISALQPEPGQVAFFPVIDAIQDFRVETNTTPAEFGRFNGGLVNLTTRSGTNEVHGSAFEFIRNEVFNARNLFAPESARDPNEPRFRRNQFGFVDGGPIRRNKSFFMVDYQGTRQSIGRARISTVPTLLQREGVFTGRLVARSPKSMILRRQSLDRPAG